MTRNQITKAASKLSVNDFINWVDQNNLIYDILDQDNLLNASEGFLNIEITYPSEGVAESEALLFINGEYHG